MKVNRKGWNDAIALRLKLNELPTAELEAMLTERDGRKLRHDAKTRDAAAVVLRVRGWKAS